MDAFFPLLNNQHEQVARPGCLIKSNGYTLHHTSAIGTNGAVPQKLLIDIGAPDNTETYSGTLTGLDVVIPFSYLTDGSASAAELRDGIYDDLVGNPLIGNIVLSVVKQGNDVLITMLPGITGIIAYTLNPSTALVTVNTAAVAATQYKFGRVVVSSAPVQEGLAGEIITEGVSAPTSASVSASFCLVLDAGNDPTFDTIGSETGYQVGPLPGRSFLVAKRGGKNWYAVEAPGVTPTHLGAVYVEGAAGAENGRLYTVGGGDRVLWSDARWILITTGSTTTAAIEL